MSALKFIGIYLFLLCGIIHQSHSQEIKIGEVTNEIRLGPFAGNSNLSMGVRNILEELLIDLDYDLWDGADTQINIRLVFFDVKNIGKSIGIYHNKVSATQIIAILFPIFFTSKKTKRILI